MATVGAYEAKTHLAQLLERVARGEKITITRRGKPVAMLVPPPPDARSVKETIAAMLAYRDREKRTLGDITVRELIEEGRRY